MLQVIVISLGLSVGGGAAPSHSLNTTHQNTDGSYTVTYSNPGSILAPKRDAARFTADEGNNGTLPEISRKGRL